MKGGLVTLVGYKAISFVIGLALICAVIVAMVGPSDAGKAGASGGKFFGAGFGIAVHKVIPGMVDGFKSTSDDKKGGKN